MKYEYKIVEHTEGDFDDLLNEYGREGWEVFQVINGGSLSSNVAFMKRAMKELV